MANLPDSDKPFVDEAWEKVLRLAGVREHAFSWKLSDLIDQGTDQSPTWGTVTANQFKMGDTADTSGTPGAATINKAAGTVSIGAGNASVVVTNSLVTAASIVLAVIQTADATLTSIKSVVPGSGSFTITGNANATGTTKISFVVLS